MTDPATMFDESRADVAADLDSLVAALVDAHDRCSCGGPVDSTGHLLAFADICRAQLRPDVVARLLVEAVARLALSKECQ